MTEKRRIKKRNKFKFNLNEPFNKHTRKNTLFRPRYYYGGVIGFLRRYGIKAHRNWNLREKTTHKFKRFYWINAIFE